MKNSLHVLIANLKERTLIHKKVSYLIKKNEFAQFAINLTCDQILKYIQFGMCRKWPFSKCSLFLFETQLILCLPYCPAGIMASL